MTTKVLKGGAAAIVVVAAIAVGPTVMVPAAAQMMQYGGPQTMQQLPGVMRETVRQVPLTQVTDAKKTLASASIVDKDGNSVGSVSSVQTDSNGQPTEIRADVGGFLGVGSKVVSFDPARMKYERARNVLITNMTKDEIKTLPEAKA